MNSDKHRAGNALLYVLLALALLAGLTMVIGRQNDQAGGENLNSEKADLLATQMIAYAAAAKGTVDQMMMSGTALSNLDYKKPSQAGYDTPPYHNRIFHPDGGGLTYPAIDKVNLFAEISSSVPAGWYFNQLAQVQWTPTSARDLVLVAYQIRRDVCESINKKITGSKTIPSISGAMGDPLVGTPNGSGSDVPLDSAKCPGCVGWPTLCVGNFDNSAFSYYNVISGQ